MKKFIIIIVLRLISRSLVAKIDIYLKIPNQGLLWVNSKSSPETKVTLLELYYIIE